MHSQSRLDTAQLQSRTFAQEIELPRVYLAEFCLNLIRRWGHDGEIAGKTNRAEARFPGNLREGAPDAEAPDECETPGDQAFREGVDAVPPCRLFVHDL